MTIPLPKQNKKHIKQLSEQHKRKNHNDNDCDQSVYQFTCKFDEY